MRRHGPVVVLQLQADEPLGSEKKLAARMRVQWRLLFGVHFETFVDDRRERAEVGVVGLEVGRPLRDVGRQMHDGSRFVGPAMVASYGRKK